MSHTERIHYRTCNLCEALCGIKITLHGDEIVSIKGDEDDPFSQGHICPKATALADVYHDPDRLKRPVRRLPNGEWEEMAWDDAFDYVAQRLYAVQREHGGDAIAVYQGNPNAHNFGSIVYSPGFVRTLRTKNRFSATSADQLPHHFVSMHMLGHENMLPVPDVDRTQFWLILGANPLASNGSLMTAPGIRRRLRAIQKRGGKVVVVDPRRTETAKIADAHHFIRPGTDALLLAAMVNEMFAVELVNTGRLLSVIDGLDDLAQAMAPFTPERVAPLCGIAADDIRTLTADFCAASAAVAYGRIGTSTQAFGGLATWLVYVLNLLSGNFDEPGGMMLPLPAIDTVALVPSRRLRHNRWQSRVRGLPETNGELPVAVMAEEMLTPGPGQIRALVTSAGNPVLSTPNGRQLDDALAQLDFMVSIDIYINETTRHADVTLPPTTGLETANYDVVFHALAVRNTAKWSEALFEKSDEQRHDWQIFQALRTRMETLSGRKRNLPRKRARLDVLGRMAPAQLVDLTLRLGPYGVAGNHDAHGKSLKLRHLRENPHGIDLGPLQPLLPQRLPTGRIQLAPAPLVADVARLERLLGEPAGSSLVLIGRRHLRSNNSWMHNSQRLVKGKNHCTILMHPADASQRQLQHGDPVAVASRVGRVELPLEISDAIMPGVVSIPHGWGHDRPGVRLATAQAHPGASINDLTDDKLVDPLTGNVAFSGVPVTVEPVA